MPWAIIAQEWIREGKGFVCNGSFLNPGATVYGRAPAAILLDKPLKPRFFSIELDNPWSPCISRDGKMLVLIVDSQSAAATRMIGISNGYPPVKMPVAYQTPLRPRFMS